MEEELFAEEPRSGGRVPHVCILFPEALSSRACEGSATPWLLTRSLIVPSFVRMTTTLKGGDSYVRTRSADDIQSHDGLTRSADTAVASGYLEEDVFQRRFADIDVDDAN